MFKMETDVSGAVAATLQNTIVVKIGERMDIFNAPTIMQQFNELVDHGATHFIIDLSRVRVTDSDGDYPLLHLLKRSQEVGGSVSLICPVGNPIRVFYEMLRLDTLFEMAETLEIALAKLGLPPE